jgi:alpha-amylase
LRDVILHAFDWPFSTIAARAPQIAQHGYGAVLVACPLYTDERGTAWWQRYQPKDYRVVRSYLGRKRDFAAAIEALHAQGVRVYVDLVFNHMANEKQARPDPYHFPGARELERYRADPTFEDDRLYGDLSVGLFSPWDFNPHGDIQNWNCPWEVAERWLSGLPDLDLNPWVIEQQRACLRALNDMGVDGYRVDALKHLPREHLRQVFETGDADGKFVFGEVLTSGDHHEALFLWPLIAQSTWPCYDFPLHETMLRAFAPSGSLRELVDPARHGQALPWNRAVTFTVTHDIPHNREFRGQLMNAHDEYLALAYVMGRDGGVPLIYSDDNQSAEHHPTDRDRWNDAWRRYDVVQMLRFHNAVHGTPQRSFYDADGFLVFARGDHGIVAINKTEDWQHPTISTDGLRRGSYRCQLHQNVMTVDEGPLRLAIPPRQAQLWLHTDH